MSCRCFRPGQSVPLLTKTSPKPPKKALWFLSSPAFWHYCFLPGCPLISTLHTGANLLSATAESRKKALHKKYITHVSLSSQSHSSRSLIKSGRYRLSTLHFNGKNKTLLYHSASGLLCGEGRGLPSRGDALHPAVLMESYQPTNYFGARIWVGSRSPVTYQATTCKRPVNSLSKGRVPIPSNI